VRRASSFSFDVADRGATTACIHRAAEPVGATVLLAHGAGAGQRHPFMIDMVQRLTARGLDVMTFDFLYMAAGRKIPDRIAVLEATWHAAIAVARARAGLPTARLYLAGKSMGGRIASMVAAQDPALPVQGLVLLGYPLHPPKQPSVRRDQHLPAIRIPMLFVQGTRDELGDGDELRAVTRKLPGATLHLVKGGDHSLRLPKREGPESQERALAGAADAIASFVRGGVAKRTRKVSARPVKTRTRA